MQRNVICAWESLTRLRHSVVQKRLQLEKRRLEMKLNFVLRSQVSSIPDPDHLVCVQTYHL